MEAATASGSSVAYLFRTEHNQGFTSQGMYCSLTPTFGQPPPALKAHSSTLIGNLVWVSLVDSSSLLTESILSSTNVLCFGLLFNWLTE